MTVPRSAHDRFARYLLGSAPLARDFFHHYLPEELRNALALDSAELVEGSVVDEQLRQHHSDLLYRVEGLHGEPHWIYLLIEHKSHPDRATPFQLLRYINRLWERLEGDPQHGLPLPIVPLVLYHGVRPWPFGNTLQAAWSLVEPFRSVGPDLHYRLCDLSGLDDAQIRGDIVLQIGLRLLKHIHDPELGPQLPGLLGLLEQLGEKQTALEYLEVMLRYAVATGHGVTPEDVRQTIHRVIPEREEVLMSTLAEQWVDEGRTEKEIELLIVALEAKFGPLEADRLQQIRQAKSEQRLNWLVRSMTAVSLETVFGA